MRISVYDGNYGVDDKGEGAYNYLPYLNGAKVLFAVEADDAEGWVLAYDNDEMIPVGDGGFLCITDMSPSFKFGKVELRKG